MSQFDVHQVKINAKKAFGKQSIINIGTAIKNYGLEAVLLNLHHVENNGDGSYTKNLITFFTRFLICALDAKVEILNNSLFVNEIYVYDLFCEERRSKDVVWLLYKLLKHIGVRDIQNEIPLYFVRNDEDLVDYIGALVYRQRYLSVLKENLAFALKPKVDGKKPSFNSKTNQIGRAILERSEFKPMKSETEKPSVIKLFIRPNLIQRLHLTHGYRNVYDAQCGVDPSKLVKVAEGDLTDAGYVQVFHEDSCYWLLINEHDDLAGAEKEVLEKLPHLKYVKFNTDDDDDKSKMFYDDYALKIQWLDWASGTSPNKPVNQPAPKWVADLQADFKTVL